jgi:ABC-2 type transport system permease protein
MTQQSIALYTLVRREILRMFRIYTQVFLPAIITTSLYFLIFGHLIGDRIGHISQIPYIVFIAPGLIMMTVINNSYGNVSSSLFSARFQKNIEELLVSPMSTWSILLGYVCGGIIRGLIVAGLVLGVSAFFIPIHIAHPWLFILLILLIASIFSLAGFTNALFARTFDDIMIIPTFILTPMTYLGGVFYSTQMLQPFWHHITHYNPIWHMMSALRYAMLDYQESYLAQSSWIIGLLLCMLVGLNTFLLRQGRGLRD